MVVIADRVIERWRTLEEQTSKPSIVLLFSPSSEQSGAKAKLERAVADVIRAFDEGPDLPPGHDELRVGTWSVGHAPDGVVLQVGQKCDAFEEMLRAVAAGLERQAVEGTFDLYEPRAIQTPPRIAHLLECRLRVRGERHHMAGPNYRWRANARSFSDLVLAAERWYGVGGELAVRSLRVGSLPAVPVLPGDDVSVLLRDAIEATNSEAAFELASVTPDGFRSVVAAPWFGRVSLLEGGARIAMGRWEPALEHFTALLAAVSELVVYGFVKRGSNRAMAALGQSLYRDWPRPPHEGENRSAEAFEDSYVPDACGMQLLGPGYAGRVPLGDRWKATHLDDDSVLLEHTEPSAWFETSFAPFGGIPFGSPSPEAPGVLTAARADFATIMFRDDVPARG